MDERRHISSEEVWHSQAEGSSETQVPSPGRKQILRRLRFLASAKALLITIAVAFFLKLFVVEAFRIPSGSMENTLLVGDFLLVNKLAYGLKTPRYIPFTTKPIRSYTFPSFSGVRRGDVLVFEYPGKRGLTEENGPIYFIKRCVGLPGDTISITGGRVTVNSREVLLPVNAKSQKSSYSSSRDDYGPTIVPRKGEIIALAPEDVDRWREFLEREHHHVGIADDGSVLIDGKPRSEYQVEGNYYFVLGDNRGNSLDSRVWGFVPEGAIVGEALLVYWSWSPEYPDGATQAKIGNIRWDRIGMLIR